ncbi:MAG TPA: aspartate kinase [Chryseosolibacter sp.]
MVNILRNRFSDEKMKVFKFGGASVKDVRGVENVAIILQSFTQTPLLIVVSAMGKTTNALEKILHQFRHHTDHTAELTSLKHFHATIMSGLFPPAHIVFRMVNNLFTELESQLRRDGNYDEVYDQVVSFGELISTVIVHQYLLEKNISCEWIDARDYVFTDDTFREGKVDWDKTCAAISKLKPDIRKRHFILTQGFIGRAGNGLTTTLGRDGSDFSAAIFASCLEAEAVTIWKDVPGVMNADPKRLPAATVFTELPFREAAEMTYYGASVIHPKTIRPLATRGIPLYVKSFDNPSLPGTVIHECRVEDLPPLIVFKENQCLISCKVTDYTFITEDHLRQVFSVLAELNVRINVMQNSAISISFCIDFDENKLKQLLNRLQATFEVHYNTGLTLITVKNYGQENFDFYRKQPGVLLEQSSRSTLQVLVRK